MTSWAEFLGDDAEPEGGAEEDGRRGWLGRLRESLAGSRKALTQDLFFNPADAAITIGVLILLLRAVLLRQARLTETT